ncbi:putative phage abortive infection protein, partial [Prevotella sp.]|uniref:putative phage abortive infection protein n=1 Tax=Prevotella sp. TaxID=59823 RepID=UPI004025A5EF
MTDNNQESKIISKGLFWSIIFICILISGGILLLFFLNREYGCEYPVDNGLFGTYGDFIGGVVGTIVAFYSAFLLVKTLQSQENVNQSVIETNNQISIASGKELYNTLLEVFNNKFERFMTCYQNAIDNYVLEKNNELLTGRKAFEKIASEFICNDFNNNNDYLRRTQSAISEYVDFYSNNRLYLAVHFRMLYLLTSLVSTSGLETNDKVLYAKLIRGQLSESEMTMLRYNCHSEYGVKMHKFCNEFNLIKHLPVMEFLEFHEQY